MTPEEIQGVLHQQVYASALQIASDRPILRNHHKSYVQSICDALFGSEWNNYSRDEQQAKKNAIEEEYEKMLVRYVPVLELKPDDAFVAKMLGKAKDINGEPTDESNDESTDESTDEMVALRDQAARDKLGQRYWTYKQNRPDIVQRREAAPAPQCALLDFKAIPLNEDNKTKTCPQCAKKIVKDGFKQHYLQIHYHDPCSAVFCPLCSRDGKEFASWRADAYGIDVHLWFRHRTILNKKTDISYWLKESARPKRRAEDKRKAEDKGRTKASRRVAQTAVEADEQEAEQADNVHQDDGSEGTDEETMPAAMSDKGFMEWLGRSIEADDDMLASSL